MRLVQCGSGAIEVAPPPMRDFSEVHVISSGKLVTLSISESSDGWQAELSVEESCWIGGQRMVYSTSEEAIRAARSLLYRLFPAHTCDASCRLFDT